MPTPGETEIVDLSGNGKGVNLSLSITGTGLSVENVQDILAGMVKAGTNINIDYDDFNAELTINAEGVTTTPVTVSVSPDTVGPATQGVAFNQAFSAIGGAAPYSFSITVGSIPAGLTLTALGVLSGTPSGNGTSNFTVAATDANGYVGSRAYSLIVNVPASITAPVLVKTSSAGASPITWTTQLNMDNTFAGYTLHVQVDDSLTPAVDGNGTFTSPTQDVYHELSLNDIETGDIDLGDDGFITWSGAGAVHVRVERDDGVNSAWSNILTDTISASVAQLTSTDGASKSQLILVTGAPPLTFTGQAGGAKQLVRSTIQQVPSLAQYEITIGSSNDDIVFGLDDGTTSFAGIDPAGGYPGRTNNKGVLITFWTSGTKNYIQMDWNAAANSVFLANNVAGVYATGDIFAVEMNKATNEIKLFRTRSGVTTQIGATQTINALSAYYAYGAAQNNTVTGTFNFGGSAWARTPPAPVWG